MCKWASWFICSISLLLVYDARALDTELKNLRWDWEVYNEKTGHYEPYFKQNKSKAIRFKLDLNKFQSSYLKLALSENYFVRIDGELVFANLEKTTHFWGLDSLKDVFEKDRLFITLYSAEFNEPLVGTSIVSIQAEDSISTNESVFLQKRTNGQLDKFIIISIVTLSLIALFRAFNFRLFREYFSFGKSLQLRQNFDLIIAHAPLSWPNLAFMLFYAILVGNTVMNIGLFQTESTFEIPMDLLQVGSISVGIMVCIICFVFMLGKLLLITLGTELFKINKVRVVHFFAYFRLSLIMALIMFSLSLINGIFGGVIVNEYWKLLQLIIVLAWTGRLVLMFFVLNKIYTFRKLHLFSYLCSSELIPLLLFFKIFLK
ncbi:protein of unknown function [Reichenbachiella faecimaris]|uniref:DUF4271 domain-containing protein n=1 Tax=Reichenbachiella faecimaris TaxID=692418 RepID=A0A1W2GFJ9_REIFA|nr:DUF4271 domain-containing protein [Reichenbachiella faecimaris]SMD35417.1 protein of unknown function [Reichenbachiella faecimaris]